MDSALPC